MTLIEFAQKYHDMRALQKEYFRTRSYTVLEDSKRAEKELDKIAEEIIKEQKQPKLF